MRRPVVLVLLLVAFAVVLVLRAGFGDRAPAVVPVGGPAMLAGSPVQDFTVARLGGGTGNLAAYRGKVVLANVWATWCEPCRLETPDLARLARAEGRKGLVVVGIDQGEAAATVAAFVRAKRLPYPILLDDDQQFGRAYAVAGLPVSVLVDRDGRVARGIQGALTYEQMRAAVDPLLAARR